jgi:PRC-barrel domain protein
VNAAGRQSGRFQGVLPAGILTFIALAGLSGCNTTRPTTSPAAQPAAEPSAQPSAQTAAPQVSAEETGTPAAAPPPVAPPLPPPVEVNPPATADSTPPPCQCSQPPPKPRPKHKRKQKEPVKESEPQSVGPVPPPAATVVNAEVGRIDGPLTSILGRNVYSPQGEDLGRVVDLLADPEGRVRVAIVDFGGFLGVGTRRIAVDWPLLHFTPGDKDKPLMLTVTREKLQSAPEYKGAASPRVLIPPAAAPDAAGAGPKE